MTPTPQKQPAVHAIGIHFDGKGFIYAKPDKQDASTINVRKGDRVKWRSELGNYSILFKGESPFEEIAVHGRKGAETTVLTVIGEPGSYEYAVTVVLESGLRVDDPIVIVGDDGG